jgi:hypothetical protein
MIILGPKDKGRFRSNFENKNDGTYLSEEDYTPNFTDNL